MNYEIPLTCAPDCRQHFTVTLLDDEDEKVNVVIELRLRYLDRYDIWLADVVKMATDEVVVAGAPLVLGIDILGQLGYKKAGSCAMVQMLPTELEHPDNKTLGSTFVMIWGDSR